MMLHEYVLITANQQLLPKYIPNQTISQMKQYSVQNMFRISERRAIYFEVVKPFAERNLIFHDDVRKTVTLNEEDLLALTLILPQHVALMRTTNDN